MVYRPLPFLKKENTTFGDALSVVESAGAASGLLAITSSERSIITFLEVPAGVDQEFAACSATGKHIVMGNIPAAIFPRAAILFDWTARSSLLAFSSSTLASALVIQWEVSTVPATIIKIPAKISRYTWDFGKHRHNSPVSSAHETRAEKREGHSKIPPLNLFYFLVM